MDTKVTIRTRLRDVSKETKCPHVKCRLVDGAIEFVLSKNLVLIPGSSEMVKFPGEILVSYEGDVPFCGVMEDIIINHNRGYASAYSSENGDVFYHKTNTATGEWLLMNSAKHLVLIRGGIDVIGRMNIIYDGVSLVIPGSPESITLTEVVL